MTTLPRRVETVVVGAGQAGLTMSWHLQRAGREHAILERRDSLGGGWQDRWDQFRLVSPNWTASFPDAPYDGDDPDGYMPRAEIVERVARYAKTIAAPVLLDTGVDRLRRVGQDHFVLDTTQGQVAAREVVVATGGFHVAMTPALAAGLASHVLSLHSSSYRCEPDLPTGAILVVGSAQTGVQLVEEFRAAGREVYLSVGGAGRVPRRYRGKDIFFWLHAMAMRGEDLGTPLPTVGNLPDMRRRLAGNPHLSGHSGGHDTDLRRISRDGTTLLGRLTGVDGERLRFGADLHANLDFADGFFDERFRGLIDAYIAAADIDAPPADPATRVGFVPEMIEQLDLARAGISTVLWTTGYRQDLRWIDLPITDEMGFARQVRGVSEVPGLFFIGSLWQHDLASATLFGIGRDAQVLADRMGLAA